MDKVFERVVSLIEIIDREEMTGEEKKQHVQNIIESSIKSMDTYDNSNYEEIEGSISIIIDLIVFLSKNKKLLNGINHITKNYCFSCISDRLK
jgi:ribulose 1,5-bisphosphate carboxylase large subunit-like protein